MVPEYHQEERQCTVTYMRYVPEVVTRQVTCLQPQQVVVPAPCCNPCGSSCGNIVTCQMVPVTQNVQQTIMRCVPEQRIQKYTVNVCTYKAVNRTVTVSPTSSPSAFRTPTRTGTM